MVDKNWTLEDALEAHRRAKEAHPNISGPSLPLYQWVALHRLDELERLFNAGDDFSLLHAIRVCANHDLVLPDWLSRAYIGRFDKVLTYEERSWDKAFGSPFPPKTKVAQARKRRELRFQIFNRVSQILSTEPETKIDEYLFERVGKEFGVGRSYASARYYEVKNMFEESKNNPQTHQMAVVNALLDSERLEKPKNPGDT